MKAAVLGLLHSAELSTLYLQGSANDVSGVLGSPTVPVIFKARGLV